MTLTLTSIKQYARLRLFDWLFCSVISAGLSSSILAGFELNDSTSGSIPLLLLFSAVLDLFCFIGLYNRKTSLGLLGLFTAVLIGVIAYARTSDIFGDDASFASQIVAIVLILTCIATALLSLSRAGILVLLALGTLVSASAAFLQFPVRTAAFLLFLTATVLLFLYRVFSVTRKSTAGGSIRSRHFEYQFVLQMIGITLAGLALAFSFFSFVIRPLNPPTDELKLIERLEQSRIIERTGIATVYTFPNFALRSQEETDSSMTANQPEATDDPDKLSQDSDTLDEEQDEGKVKENPQDAYAIFYDLTHHYWWLFAGLILLVICLPFLIKELLRRKWYTNLSSMNRESQIVNLYGYFLRLFEKLKIHRGSDMTLREYAARQARSMEPYDPPDTDFAELTDLYVRVNYGRHEVTEAEAEKYHQYYQGLRGRIRRETGLFRFLLKYFTI